MYYLVRATAAEGMLRAFCVTERDTVEAARKAHNTSPVATAALGRLMAAALMMGADLKEEGALLTLKIGCDGPIGGLLVTADGQGNVKGYVNEPGVMLPANEFGKLDVGGALGNGVLSVIRDIGLKEPYVGQTMLVSGEIAEDITYYFAASEQTPSSVALGVLMNRDNTVRRAGGFMLQLMPGAPEELISALEERISHIRPVTELLDREMTPEEILSEVLTGFQPEFHGQTPVRFLCGCTRERVEKALISIGKKELAEMIAEGKDIETVCHFCGKKYRFTPEELQTLLEKARS